MKRCLSLLVTAVLTATLISCEMPPSNNATATNADKPGANSNIAKSGAPPTVGALMALETRAFEARKRRDGKFFEGFLAENFTMRDANGRTLDKSAIVKAISDNKCEAKELSLSDEKMVMAGADAAVILTKVAADGTCPDAKGVQQKMPSPGISATVYVRSGGDWKGAFHKEVAIVDPAAMKPGDGAKQPPAPPAKAEKDVSTDEKTDALLAVERRIWEAWKARDAKPLEETLAADFLFVDIFGNVIGSKADAIKAWTTDNKCEVKSFSLSDASSVSIATDASLLNFKATAEGTCSGVPLNFTIWGSGVYIKEGDAWKYVFGFNKTA